MDIYNDISWLAVLSVNSTIQKKKRQPLLTA